VLNGRSWCWYSFGGTICGRVIVGRAVGIRRDLERAAVQCASPAFSRRRGVDREAGLASVAAMGSSCAVGSRGDCSRRALCCNSSLALLHICTTVALVRGDSTWTLSTRCGVRESAGPLQLSKDCIFVSKQIAHETVAVALVHAQGRLLSWAKNAWCKCVCKSSNVGLIG
jgi:hypothetical protein